MNRYLATLMVCGGILSFVNQVLLSAEIVWLPAYAEKLNGLFQVNPEAAWHFAMTKLMWYCHQLVMQIVSVTAFAYVSGSYLTNREEETF